ncbi:MAG: VCBS repeat-containing protein [Planctomycetota bacterium]
MRLSLTDVAVLSVVVCLGSGAQCFNPGPQMFGKTVDWQQRTVATVGVANSRPTVVEVNDFDGDTRLDIVAGFQGDGVTLPSVFIFFQDDVDNFTAVEIGSHADLSGVIALAVGDLDNDTHDDVVAACDGRIIYFNSPNVPRTAAGWAFTTIAESDDAGTGQWNDVAIGSIDAANGLDIVASNEGNDWLSWFVNPGNAANGTGWTRVHIDATTRNASAGLALSDIDGDGDTDVFSVAPSETAARVAWYGNPAAPAVDAWTKTTIGNLSGANRVAVGDLDNDGDGDLVVTSTVLTGGTGRIIGWYQHPVTATTAWSGYELTRYTSASLGPPVPTDVKVADVDGDSQLDVIVATETAGTLRWFIPVGQQANPWGENNIRDLTEDIGRIAVGDIDGDGRPDVVAPLQAATTAQDTIAWFENPE